MGVNTTNPGAHLPPSTIRPPDQVTLHALGLTPSLAASAFVLTVFADSGEVLESLVRPLVVGIVVALVVQALCIVATRKWMLGTLVADLIIATTIHPLFGLFLALVGGVAWGVSRRRNWDFSALVAGAVAIFFTLSLVRAAASPAFALSDLLPPTQRAAEMDTEAPDIFLILMDAYPRTDALQAMGYDNRWFASELAERNFELASRAHTNYSWTYLVVPTMFHMRHAADIPELADAGMNRAAQRHAVREALRETPAGDVLRSMGYRLLSTGVDAHSLTLRDVDGYLGSGQLTVFEHQVLERTALRDLLMPFIVRGYRDRTVEALAATASVADNPGSTFVFTHLWNPHVPFVFTKDGSVPELTCPDECDPFRIGAEASGLGRQAFDRAYAEQVDYLNHRILEVVDEIIDRSPEAVVILFSDHGTRSDSTVSAEWFSSFFAARTPNREEVFPDDVRPIEIFPRLFSSYFDISIPIPVDRSFQSPHGNLLPLVLEEWP